MCWIQYICWMQEGGIGYETVVCGWYRTGQSGKNDV